MTAPRPSLGLLDTSVLVAMEQDRPLRDDFLPKGGITSIVTVAELRAGVLAAPDIPSRDRRIATLEQVWKLPTLPIDEPVARAWAAMRTYLVAAGRRVGVNDLWIAATAAANEIPLITQDAGFDPLSGVAGLTIVEA